MRPATEGLVGLSSSADNDSSGIGTGAKSEYAFFLNRTVGGVSGENGLTSRSTGVKELKKNVRMIATVKLKITISKN